MPKARETYLDEADFEIHEIESLAKRGVRIAPTEEKWAIVQLISAAATTYAGAVEIVAQGVEKNGSAAQTMSPPTKPPRNT